MTKLGFYPGCSLEGSTKELGESFAAVAAFAGLELEEIKDWNCCGASAAHMLSHKLSLALPARILALAEQQGLKEVLVPCASCFNRLASTRYELLANEELRRDISNVIEMEYRGTAEVINSITFFSQLLTHGLEEKLVASFDYAVACYYGCLLVRPPKVVLCDRPEDPRSMEEIMLKLGARPLDWAFKTECCGASFSISRGDVVVNLVGKIIKDAERRGADAIIVACPLCHANLDMRQGKAESRGRKSGMPIVHLTQALGLALGLSEKALGLQRHFVPVHLPVKRLAVATAAAGRAGSGA